MKSRSKFFSFLENALYKKPMDVSEESVDNSDLYMLLRYASFYHPKLVNHINNINKKIKFFNKEETGKYFFQVLKSSLPKLNKVYIEYVAKKSLKGGDKLKEFVEEYSKRYNISQAKVWDMLHLKQEIENNHG